MQYLLRVVPVIGILHNRKAFKPTPNPGEVEEVFDAPLEMFLKVFFAHCLVFVIFFSCYDCFLRIMFEMFVSG